MHKVEVGMVVWMVGCDDVCCEVADVCEVVVHDGILDDFDC